MEEQELFNLKEGDAFIFPDHYVNSGMKVVKHNYIGIILAIIIDDDALQGFTIKRYLKTRKGWSYEFFDVYKMRDRCNLKQPRKA